MPAVEAKPVEARAAVEVKPVEARVETRPVEAARPVEPARIAAPEPPGAVAPAEARKPPGAVEVAGRRVGGAFLDTFVASIRSKPVQVIASFGVAFVAAGLVIYLAPKALGTLLKAAGATDDQITTISWALAIVVAVIVFVICWRWLIKPAMKKVK